MTINIIDAISRAKRSDSAEVEPDHVLTVCLLAVARFGIARIGPLAIDLVDRAAAIARADQAMAPRMSHLLAAFATPEPQGLMAHLEKNGIDSEAWRTAMADFDALPAPASAANDATTVDSRTYVSPEQAAEILGVHHQTIRGYIRSGKLPAWKIAGERAVRIRRESLDRLMEPVASAESE